jgi:hypothetical protein
MVELYLDGKKQGEYKDYSEAKKTAMKSRAKTIEFRLAEKSELKRSSAEGSVEANGRK